MVMEKDKKIKIIVGILILAIMTVAIIYLTSKKGLKYPKNALWASDNNGKTLKMVDELHPKVKQDVADFFSDLEKQGFVVLGTSGLRTSANQAGLNTTNSQNASAGHSDHEYGFAIDINVKKNGTIILRKSSTKQEWLDSGVVATAKKYKLKWGGDFKSYHDPIHFYNDFGMRSGDMIKNKLAGKVDKEGYLIV